MPKFLTKLNHKLVPTNSLLISIITLQIFILFAYFTDSVYLVMIQLATSLILVPYLLVGIYAFRLIILTQKINYLDLIKGFIAVLYGIWLIYAGGLKYLLFSTMLYSTGFFVYYYGRWEQKKQIFNNMVEILFCILLFVIAIAVIFFWQQNIIVL
jgi:arginine:ornithine antiporter/lysine permease